MNYNLKRNNEKWVSRLSLAINLVTTSGNGYGMGRVVCGCLGKSWEGGIKWLF